MSLVLSLPVRHMLVSLVILTLAFSASAMPPDDAFQTTSTMRDETRDLVKYLEKIHYAGMPIHDIDAGELIKTYMSDLDFQRLFFYDEDREEFNLRFKGMLDIYLRQGTLMPAFEVFKVYRQRALKRLDWVDQRLQEPFDFEKDEYYMPDRSEADWPASEQEADALWERRLKYELIVEMLSHGDSSDDLAEQVSADIPDQPLEYLDEARKAVGKRYAQIRRNVEQMEPVEVQERFLTSLTHMYDPHSTFFSADSLEDFAIAMKNSLVGIGAVLSTQDGYCTIKELVPGGPADTSNELSPEDKIIGVAQDEEEMEDVVGMKLRKIVKLIRGEKGTKVRLLIQPAEGNPTERREVVLIRDKIKLTAALAQAEIFQVPQGERTYNIGVIELPAFYGGSDGSQSNGTTRDVEELIGKLKKANVQGIVLDLRTNGGGLLSEAVNLTGLFIPTGPVVQVKNTIGHIEERSDTNSMVAWDGPLIVLTSRFSASASEIVTGALKNHRRALIVGDSTTHGKGTVQAVFEMDRLSNSFFRNDKPRRGAAKVTIQKWYLPNGNSTQIKGVPSDIALPSAREYLPIGEDDLPHALVWDSIEPLPSFDSAALNANIDLSRHLISDDLLTNLRTSSSLRQQQLQEFDYWNTRVSWLRDKSEKKVVALNLDKHLKERREEKVFQDELEKREESLAASNFGSEEVLLNITLEKEEESRLAHFGQEESEAGDAKENDVLDIHLRESLRIMADWLQQLSKQMDEPQHLASRERS